MPTIPTWKVQLYEAQSQADFAKNRVAAKPVEVFSVQADGPDAAKRAAAKWLTDRHHTLRSINVAAKEERMLFAYVAAGSVARARAMQGSS